MRKMMRKWLRKFFSSPYTWAAILIISQILNLVFMPGFTAKIVVMSIIGLGSLAITSLQKGSPASFVTGVLTTLFVAALFVAYLRICNLFPSLMEGGGLPH